MEWDLGGMKRVPDSKIHGGNMGPIWADKAHVGPMLAPWTLLSGVTSEIACYWGAWFVSLISESEDYYRQKTSSRCILKPLTGSKYLKREAFVGSLTKLKGFSNLSSRQTFI